MPTEPFVYLPTLDMCSVDFTGRWQPGAIFRAMQEAGNGHCQFLDLSFERLRELGVAWVITRAHLRMDEYPVLGQKVTVRTWPGPTRHMFFPRYYLFESEGRTLGRASTLYVLLDLETRKIALPSRLPNPLPLYDLPAPLPFPGNLSTPAAPTVTREYTPVYSDLDMNEHVNNTRYVDWFMNQFPIERHRSQTLSDLLVHYNFEVTPDEPLTLSLCEEGDVSVLQGLNDEKVCFGVEGTWRAR